MSVEFFLGANSGNGFYSLYDNFCQNEGDFLYMIKGGPGCGKSSFMRKIADAAQEHGCDVEYILCSGDPDSLDGIYIPDLKIGFADATAPHIMEPSCFAFNSNYVNLGRFCRRTESCMIEEYYTAYKKLYARAYSFLSSAAMIKKNNYFDLFDDKSLEKIKNRARNLILLCIGKRTVQRKKPVIKRRFISCISCKGSIVLKGSVNKLCKRICIVDDKLGMAHLFLDEAAQTAVSYRQEVILCPSPLLPDRLEAVLLPELETAFISGSVMQCAEPWRHIRLDAMADRNMLGLCRGEIKNAGKMYVNAVDTAVYYLSKAKTYHDMLENEYKPCVDFSALNEFTSAEIPRLFK